MRLFIDMDGVLADFDAHYEATFGVKLERRTVENGYADRVNWKMLALKRDFFLDIPPMPDMRELWEGVRHLNPTVLTAIPRSDSVPEAEANKLAWVAKHLGADVPVICRLSCEKYLQCRHGDVLIDDYEKYRHRWERMGGVFIVHTSASESLRQLRAVTAIQAAEVRP